MKLQEGPVASRENQLESLELISLSYLMVVLGCAQFAQLSR